MHTATVINVLDANTLSVWPAVSHGGRRSSLVRIRGFEAPTLRDRRGELARCRVRLFLLGSTVKITRIHGMADGAYICDVWCAGQKLLEHFPEYAPQPATHEPSRHLTLWSASDFETEEGALTGRS